MRSAFIVLVVWLGVTTTAFGCDLPEGRVAITPTEAHRLALKRFLDVTAGQVTNYVVDLSGDSCEEWQFFIRGQGKFELPGYHWIVIVSKRTGKSEVLVGK